MKISMEIDDNISFVGNTGVIKAQYKGPVKLEGFKDINLINLKFRNNLTKSASKEILSIATKIKNSTFKKLSTFHEFLDWQKENSAFLPLRPNNRDENIIWLTKENKIKEKINTIKPYGIELKYLLKFLYYPSLENTIKQSPKSFR